MLFIQEIKLDDRITECSTVWENYVNGSVATEQHSLAAHKMASPPESPELKIQSFTTLVLTSLVYNLTGSTHACCWRRDLKWCLWMPPTRC